jgi:nicotinamide-nucleotide amidase
MQASILIIGDEILNGTTQDTNSSFIARSAVANGIKIQNIFTVSDDFASIHDGLKFASQKNELIFITGGLGPTKDDITMKAIADFMGQKLVFNAFVFEKIKAYFEKRGKAQVALNEKLAYLPENCQLIENERGTAQGMWFDFEGKVFISMPGVPYEMKHMFTQFVLPLVSKKFALKTIINKYIMTAGIGESAIAEKIADIENELPKHITLAYLPSLSRVKMRLTSHIFSPEIEAEVASFQQKIAERLPKYAYSLKEDKLIEDKIGEMLLERNETIATAESCTGGFISHKLTSVAGSSHYYFGSIISYSYEMKKSELGVKQSTLDKYGAVSEETVLEMLSGLLDKLGTTYGIAVSGIAGPGGGTPDKPVGTVWIAVGTKEKQITRRYQLSTHRFMNIEISSILALNMIRRLMLNLISPKGNPYQAIN